MHKFEPTRVSVTSDPVGLPVDRADAKIFTYIDTNLDDGLIDQILESVTVAAMDYMARSLLTQTIVARFSIPTNCNDFCLALRYGPIQSVTSITSYDRGNNAVVETLADTTLSDHNMNGLITLNHNKQWADINRRLVDNVVVEYVAGYGNAADVPADIKQALYQWADALYDNRVASMPDETRRTLARHRIWTL